MAKKTLFKGTAAERVVDDEEDAGGAGNGAGGGAGGSADEEDEEDSDAGSQSEEGAGSAGKESGGEGDEDEGAGRRAGSGDRGDEGGEEGDEEEEESRGGLSRSDLRRELRALVGDKKAGGGKEERDELIVPTFTERESEALKDKYGVDHHTWNLAAGMANRMVKGMRGEMNRQLAPFQRDEALRRLSRQKGFEGVMSHRDEITDELSLFDPSMHADERVLKLVARSVMGARAGQRVRDAHTRREVGRRLNERTRDHSGSGGKKTNGKFKETPQTEYVRKKLNMSKKDYYSWMTPGT